MHRIPEAASQTPPAGFPTASRACSAIVPLATVLCRPSSSRLIACWLLKYFETSRAARETAKASAQKAEATIKMR